MKNFLILLIILFFMATNSKVILASQELIDKKDSFKELVEVSTKVNTTLNNSSNDCLEGQIGYPEQSQTIQKRNEPSACSKYFNEDVSKKLYSIIQEKWTNSSDLEEIIVNSREEIRQFLHQNGILNTETEVGLEKILQGVEREAKRSVIIRHKAMFLKIILNIENAKTINKTKHIDELKNFSFFNGMHDREISIIYDKLVQKIEKEYNTPFKNLQICNGLRYDESWKTSGKKCIPKQSRLPSPFAMLEQIFGKPIEISTERLKDKKTGPNITEQKKVTKQRLVDGSIWKIEEINYIDRPRPDKNYTAYIVHSVDEGPSPNWGDLDSIMQWKKENKEKKDISTLEMFCKTSFNPRKKDFFDFIIQISDELRK